MSKLLGLPFEECTTVKCILAKQTRQSQSVKVDPIEKVIPQNDPTPPTIGAFSLSHIEHGKKVEFGSGP